MADKEKERGRLFSIQMDGSDSVPFIIKKDKLLFGRSDACEIRIYVDGVAHEHCIITFNEEGRGFVEPVNKCGHTFLNGELIERQVSLEHNDVITVVKRSFRFHYPSSSKFYVPSESAASFEDNMICILWDKHFLGQMCLKDFEVEDVFSKRGKDLSERRVTFGPRLSPEEFDKRMPPASPLRKGSLPSDKLKAKTPSYNKQDVTKPQFKKNLFMNSPANKVFKNYEKSTKLPESSVVLNRLSYSSASMKEAIREDNSKASRPLFSEIVKKSVVNPAKNTVQNVGQKYSPQKFIKKKTKLKDSRKHFWKSPRRPVHPRLLAVGSTGHANSPETIVICKKRFSPSSVTYGKRRKSLRLLQEKVPEPSSESHESGCPDDIHEDNLLMSENISVSESMEQNDSFSRMSSKNNTPIHTPTVESRKSSATKRKVNVENKADTTIRNRDEDMSLRKKNENSTPSSRKSENYTPARKSVGSARKSVGSARKSIGTPARKSIGTPARKSIGIPARKSIGTPARKSIGTPATRSMDSPIMRNEDESEISSAEVDENEIISEEVDENGILSEEVDENGIFSEEIDENGILSEEIDENGTVSTSSSLVAAINNVAQIDQNNFDKSFKDIHNIVQALSRHSNVSTLSSDRLTADMCVNATKKLALTISMINAFHMYNRIIDDVSTFPLCFPSTSFDSNRDSLRRLPRSVSHQNEDFARMSWFQDMMHNFFSNSASNETRRMLRTSEDGLSPDNELTMSNKRSRRSKVMPGNKMPLRAIASGHKTPTRKSGGSQISFVSRDEDDDESNHSDENNECMPAVTASGHPKSPRTPMHNKEKSSATTRRISVSLDKDNVLHSSSLNNLPSDDLSLSNCILQKSKTPKTSPVSGRQSSRKSVELISDSSSASPEKKKKSLHKKSPHIFKSRIALKESLKEKISDSNVAAYSKELRSKTSTLIKQKQPRVKFVAKKVGMTTSKKLKAQKSEQKHRSVVLKKVKYRIVSPKMLNLKNFKKTPEPLRTSLKRISGQSDLIKPKLARLSQKYYNVKGKLNKTKSEARLSQAFQPSSKLVTSPNALKKYPKRKSVIFRSRGIKSKKSIGSVKLFSQKRKSTVSSLSPKTSNKRVKRNRSDNVQNDFNKENDIPIDKKSQSTKIDSETVSEPAPKNTRKRKMKFDDNLDSALTENILDNKKTDEKRKTTKRKKNQMKSNTTSPKKTTRSTRRQNTQDTHMNHVTNEENAEIKDNKQTTKKVKTAKRNVKSQVKLNTEAPKRSTRNTRRQGTHNIEVHDMLDEEHLEVKDVEKVDQRKGRKRKIDLAKRPTKVSMLEADEVAEEKSTIETDVEKVSQGKGRKRKVVPKRPVKTSLFEEDKAAVEKSTAETDSEKVDKRKGRKRKVDDTKEPVKISLPEEDKMTEEKVANKKSKKETFTSKDTPKKDVEKVDKRKGRKRKVDVTKEPVTISLLEDDEVAEEKSVTKPNKTESSKSKDTTKKDLEKVEKRRKRKVGVKKGPVTVEDDDVAEEKSATKKNKKQISSSEDTTKKGKTKGVSKRTKVQTEASPIQRVQRSLRSRK